MPPSEKERVAEEYSSTLNELLQSISKVHINTLTMLAEENKEYAVQIATCIENHFKAVSNKLKLPVLYLIDSICKNYPESSYVQLFTQNIVSNFCHVFEVSDEKVRRLLHKLRLTWDTSKIFPQKKLMAIDEKVHKMDPNWPVPRKNVTSNQAQGNQQPQQRQQQQQQQRHQQQQSQQQQPQQNPPNGGQKRTRNRGGNAKRAKLALINRNTVPMLLCCPEPILVPPFVEQPFIEQPIIQQAYIEQPTIQQPYIEQQIPKFEPHLTLLESLYGGKQCSNCSLRFDDNNRYASHLDWHFRQNLMSDKMFARRKWYYPLELWVQFREINDDENQDNTNSDSTQNNQLLVNDFEVPTAPASKDDQRNICSVCRETFEKFWAEEEEEWRLKNAKMHEDDMVYHPLCLKDMLQASY